MKIYNVTSERRYRFDTEGRVRYNAFFTDKEEAEDFMGFIERTFTDVEDHNDLEEIETSTFADFVPDIKEEIKDARDWEIKKSPSKFAFYKKLITKYSPTDFQI